MKTPAACARFADVADARALGETPSAADLRFVEAHRESCAACRRDASLFDALDRYDAEEERPEVSRHPEVSPRPSSVRRLGLLGAAAAVAAAAAAVYVLALRGDVVSQPAVVNASRAVPSVRVVLAEGAAVDAVGVAEVAPVEGARFDVPAGRVCLRFDTDVAACFGPGADGAPARARVVASTAGERALAIEQGVVSVDVTPGSGHAFAVETRHGRVVVVGTVFTVRTGNEGSRVGVAHGRVRVESEGGATSVDGGEVLVFGGGAKGGTRSAYATSDRDADAALLRGSDLFRGGDDARIVVRGAPGCSAALDGVSVGAAPLWIRVAPSRRELQLDGACSLRERVDLGAGSEHVVDATPSRSSEVPAGSAALHAAPSNDAAEGDLERTPSSLLARAQELRRQGRAEDALAVYEELTVRHPASPEAQAARISVGKAKLARGDPTGALGEFERYLARGGPLAPEAEIGRIGCLRALGRAADEASAIERFVAAHPDAIQTEALRARLVEIAPR